MDGVAARAAKVGSRGACGRLRSSSVLASSALKHCRAVRERALGARTNRSGMCTQSRRLRRDRPTAPPRDRAASASGGRSRAIRGYVCVGFDGIRRMREYLDFVTLEPTLFSLQRRGYSYAECVRRRGRRRHRLPSSSAHLPPPPAPARNDAAAPFLSLTRVSASSSLPPGRCSRTHPLRRRRRNLDLDRSHPTPQNAGTTTRRPTRRRSHR